MTVAVPLLFVPCAYTSLYCELVLATLYLPALYWFVVWVAREPEGSLIMLCYECTLDSMPCCSTD